MRLKDILSVNGKPMKHIVYFLIFITVMNYSCKSKEGSTSKLIVIDPQHFHAALVQKVANPLIDENVHLFSPSESKTAGYRSLIQQYNSRQENPTHWVIKEYYGADFLTKAFEKDNGDIVVLAGDNKEKINYIAQSVAQVKNVFADKPLVIDIQGYQKLKEILSDPKSSNLVYDIMTERYDVKNILIKELVNNNTFSGGFESNSKNPLIQFNSIHHFIKSVSGKSLVRPSMFYDVSRQGEGLVDVTTHYIDLVQWILSPEKAIDIEKQLKLVASERWSTIVTQNDFIESTLESSYPTSFNSFINKDGNLDVFSNGKMSYSLDNVPVSISVQWNVKSLDGKGDQFNAFFDLKNLYIEVKPDTNGKSSVFIKPKYSSQNFEFSLIEAIKSIKSCPGVSFMKEDNSYKLVIPEALYLSHEDHFAKVLNQFMVYKNNGNIPDWERSFMLAKYYLTTEALRTAKIKK